MRRFWTMTVWVLHACVLVGVGWALFKVWMGPPAHRASQAGTQSGHASTKDARAAGDSLHGDATALARKPFWDRAAYVVPAENWHVAMSRKHLAEGQDVMALHSVEGLGQCLLGRFELHALRADRLLLKGQRQQTRSRLEEFARARGLVVRVNVVGMSTYAHEIDPAPPCREWIHVSMH